MVGVVLAMLGVVPWAAVAPPVGVGGLGGAWRRLRQLRPPSSPS
jgi:hypothetical protein